MSLDCVGMQMLSTKTVTHGHGECQEETCHVDGLGAVNDGREAWIKGPGWQEH
jgi:hypothetical protein